MATCKECGRDVEGIRTITGRKTVLNKAGICAACVEANAEMKADRQERIREARALLQREGVKV